MIPLAVPNLSGNEARYLQRCVDEGFVSSVGPFVSRFEEQCAAAVDAQAAVATSSGTTGLHVALVAAGVGPGDLVIVPSFTFIASPNAVSHCGASPWLFDVSEESWTLDPRVVAEALARETTRVDGRLIHQPSGRRVAAMMPVYTLGLPADMDALCAIARSYALPVVADAAAAVGARHRGHNLGRLASLSVLSFNGNKTVTAGGGGAVVGGDAELLSLVRHLSTTARVGIAYDHDRVGYNYRMTNLQAAVGCAQMERVDELVARKRAIDARYREAFADIASVRPFPAPPWAESACWFSGVLIGEHTPGGVPALCASLKERGVEARTFWKPVHLQAPYAACPRTPMPVSDSVAPRVLTLPCSTGLTDADQGRVIDLVRELLT